jgi:hypothetical protein
MRSRWRVVVASSVASIKVGSKAMAFHQRGEVGRNTCPALVLQEPPKQWDRVRPCPTCAASAPGVGVAALARCHRGVAIPRLARSSGGSRPTPWVAKVWVLTTLRGVCIWRWGRGACALPSRCSDAEAGVELRWVKTHPMGIAKKLDREQRRASVGQDPPHGSDRVGLHGSIRAAVIVRCRRAALPAYSQGRRRCASCSACSSRSAPCRPLSIEYCRCQRECAKRV